MRATFSMRSALEVQLAGQNECILVLRMTVGETGPEKLPLGTVHSRSTRGLRLDDPPRMRGYLSRYRRLLPVTY